MNKLIEVLGIQTYSKNDRLMIAYLSAELASMEGVTFFLDNGNIYATKGSAPYPCMIAHTDTVHPICEDLHPVIFGGKVTGFNRVTMEQTGIGGDDKVGIYVALEMLREHTNMKCFFPRDEEIGCIGSSKVDKKWFDDVTIALQCDRRGNTDFITNASGTELSSKAFQNDVLPILRNYGYKFDRGMMTDVMELKERGIKASMANISCGYYNPHTEHEYVDIADVHKVTLMVSEIIRTLGGTYYPHELPPRKSWSRDSDDADFEWWNDTNPYGTNTTSLHDQDVACADCQMHPATGVNGLCDECWEWHKKWRTVPHKSVVAHSRTIIPELKVNFANKPDYGQTRVIKTTDDVKHVVREWKKKKKKKFGVNR